MQVDEMRAFVSLSIADRFFWPWPSFLQDYGRNFKVLSTNYEAFFGKTVLGTVWFINDGPIQSCWEPTATGFQLDLGKVSLHLSENPMQGISTTHQEISGIFQPYQYSYQQQHLTIFTILIPKWCKLPFLDSKINRGDIRLYFKSYEKIPRWRYC